MTNIYVELNSKYFPIKFSAVNDFGLKNDYEGIEINYTSQSRVYCTAIKNGMRYSTVIKKMLFDNNGNVYLKFGKEKVIIGTFKEVVA